MLRKIYLEGEIGDKFGREFEVDADNFRDAIRCIDCNVSGMRQYFMDCEERGVGFLLDVAGEPVEDIEHMLISVKAGDMTISPVPAGQKSGGAKILAAIAIAVVTFYSFGAGGVFAEGVLGMSAATASLVGYTLAINLALMGIQQLMAPDPSTDNDAGEETYLFNGSQQNIVEGDPVPVLYGELRVPGHPISFEMLNQEYVESRGTLDFRSFNRREVNP